MVARNDRLLLAIALPAILFAPFLEALFSKVTFETIVEESLGYRYFYSLRIIFGGEAPWIPQGHLVGLLHHILNLLLNIFGLSQSDLELRPFLFIWIVAGVGLMACGVALFHALSSFRSISGRALYTAIALAFFTTQSLWYFWYMLPDYQVWIAVVSIASLAWANKILEIPPTEATLKEAFCIGIFGGIALGIKVSCAIYPLTLALLWLGNAKGRVAVIGLAMMPLLGLTVFFLVLLFYYAGNIDGVWRWPSGFLLFIQSQSSTFSSASLDFSSFFSRLLDFTGGKLLWTALLALLGCLIFPIFGQRYMIAAVPGMLAILWFQYMRDYSFTSIETILYSLFVVGLLIVAFRNAIALHKNKNDTHKARVQARHFFPARVNWFMAAAIVVLTVPRFLDVSVQNVREIVAGERRYRVFADYVSQLPGSTIVLSPGNQYRIASMYSAICKGGTDIYNASWGVSPYISALFPKYACAVLEKPVDLSLFSNVLFLEIDGDVTVARNQVEKYFSISLDGFNCNYRVKQVITHYVACTRRKPAVKYLSFRG